MPSRLVGAGTGQAAGAGERGLQVVTAGDSNDDPGQIISAVAARYPLTLADPEASCVPRTLRAADQLILVAPASAEASALTCPGRRRRAAAPPNPREYRVLRR